MKPEFYNLPCSFSVTTKELATLQLLVLSPPTVMRDGHIAPVC